MKRRYRLTDRDRFWQVRREGRSWVHPLVVLCVLPNGLSYSRFGFAVSRRIGSAVRRNRVKRRLREAVRSMQPQIQPGWDIVFIARPPIAEADYRQVVAACARLLRRAHLLKQDGASGKGVEDTPTAVGNQK
ncbi:MAG: ribonuclease P protein component [Anaerolineae bacterium]|nr:ribonuclease P protein component [Anaerolineae bacterium]